MKQLLRASKTCPSRGMTSGALAGEAGNKAPDLPPGPCFSDSICLSLLILRFPIRNHEKKQPHCLQNYKSMNMLI